MPDDITTNIDWDAKFAALTAERNDYAADAARLRAELAATKEALLAIAEGSSPTRKTTTDRAPHWTQAIARAALAAGGEDTADTDRQEGEA